jgi:hypothetical protein
VVAVQWYGGSALVVAVLCAASLVSSWPCGRRSSLLLCFCVVLCGGLLFRAPAALCCSFCALPFTITQVLHTFSAY